MKVIVDKDIDNLDHFYDSELEREEFEDENYEFGKVSNCKKLYVREEPSKTSESLCVINEGDEVIVYFNESTDDFYKVCTESDVKGYCMKEFIEVPNL